MRYNFCSHFDHNYLARGLALLASMRQHLPEFRWFVVALDAPTYQKMKLVSAADSRVTVTLIQEGKELRSARAGRTWQEYVWTLEPLLPAMFLQNLDHIVYLDADCFFFDDPKALYAEVNSAGADIAIVPHRFSPGCDKSKNGIYNVSWVYFRNTENAFKCLGGWGEQCLKWCYARNEPGRFADQKYLDDWPEVYGAHVVQHLGANLAPWSQAQYAYKFDDGKLFIVDGDANDIEECSTIRRIDPLLFYHFHEWKDFGRRGNYALANDVVQHVYVPYEREMVEVGKELARAD